MVNWMPLYVVWMLKIESSFKFGKIIRTGSKDKVIWSSMQCKRRVQATLWANGEKLKKVGT